MVKPQIFRIPDKNTAPLRIANSAITGLLSSKPISNKYLFSELVVTYFDDCTGELDLTDSASRCLFDLDWEIFAEDVSEEQNAATSAE